MKNKKPIFKSGLNIKLMKSYQWRKISGRAIIKQKVYSINLTLTLDFNSSTKTDSGTKVVKKSVLVIRIQHRKKIKKWWNAFQRVI